jgi:hypothetical protein
LPAFPSIFTEGAVFRLLLPVLRALHGRALPLPLRALVNSCWARCQ